MPTANAMGVVNRPGMKVTGAWDLEVANVVLWDSIESPEKAAVMSRLLIFSKSKFL